jgi:hypothetical protein
MCKLEEEAIKKLQEIMLDLQNPENPQKISEIARLKSENLYLQSMLEFIAEKIQE